MRIAVVSAALALMSAAMGLAAEQPKAKTHTVTIEGMRFQPEVLTVASGDTIVWVNKDPVPHSATADAGSFDSERIEAGASWQYTIRNRGEFAYFCTFHPAMKARLKVR
jgi:plastocyanin